MDDYEKEPKLQTNRGFIVDLIFNFPQGASVDKESYINEIIEHMQKTYAAGWRLAKAMPDQSSFMEEDFLNWLKQPK